jgi:hypothetical protein
MEPSENQIGSVESEMTWHASCVHSAVSAGGSEWSFTLESKKRRDRGQGFMMTGVRVSRVRINTKY